MSIEPADPRDGEPVGARDVLARAMDAQASVRRLRRAAIDDLLRPDAARLDDRRRAGVRTLLRAIVGTIGADIHDHAARLLAQRGAAAAGEALARVDAAAIMAAIEPRLAEDDGVAGDLIDRVTLDLIGDALPAGLVDHVPAPWTAIGRAIEQRAGALRAAESRRRVPPDQPPYATDLPAESQARFVWWIAASILNAAGPLPPAAAAALDRAVAAGAAQSLAEADEGERLEAAAMRLATFVDLRGEALAGAVDHCLGERRVVLLVALVAHALGSDYEAVRALFVEPADARLWIVLRATGLPRTQIAHIGYALSEADRRRDVEAFADLLDPLMTLPPDDADAACSSLRLPPPLRAALAGHVA